MPEDVAISFVMPLIHLRPCQCTPHYTMYLAIHIVPAVLPLLRPSPPPPSIPFPCTPKIVLVSTLTATLPWPQVFLRAAASAALPRAASAALAHRAPRPLFNTLRGGAAPMMQRGVGMARLFSSNSDESYYKEVKAQADKVHAHPAAAYQPS